MKHTIHVTARHIAEGLRSSCYSCPVALAMTEHFEKQMVVGSVHWGESSGDLTNTIPFIAGVFIRFFDQGRVCNPFSFEVEV